MMRTEAGLTNDGGRHGLLPFKPLGIMRSIPAMRVALLLLSTFLLGSCSNRPAPPHGLMVELLRYPDEAVITDPEPEFYWIVNDDRRGATQGGYRLLVATSSRLLVPGRADVWDSGLVESDRSTAVSLRGTSLKPHTTYWWTVRTFDTDGQESGWAIPQQFITGSPNKSERSWPFESRWATLPDGSSVLENRQRPAFQSIRPERVVRQNDGTVFADFGKAAFGTLQFSVARPVAGDSAVVFLGERRTEDDRVHKEPGRSNIGFHRQVVPVQAGQRHYTVELPRHHAQYPNSQILPEHLHEVTPYRYVEILPSDSEVDSESLVQLALFYPFDDEASSFNSSDARLNRIWDLCKYTLKATPFLALYADGNRERMPYEADAHIQQLGHYSVDREYAVARYTHQFLVYNPAWPTEWHMHSVLMAWWDYLYTGDLESAEVMYDDLMRKTYYTLAGEDGLVSTRTGKATPEFLRSIYFEGDNFSDIVDWPPGTPLGEERGAYAGPSPEGERDGYVFMPFNTVVNSFHYRALRVMSKLAAALGRNRDAGMLDQRADTVFASFQRAFFDDRRGVYVDGIGTEHASLHANMFPLAFGLVPVEHLPAVLEHIKSRKMACSVYGAQFLLEGLFDAGESDYAVALMTADSKRSWINMLRVGSTMTTEAWDEAFKPNLTWNHAWGSAPANIIPRKLFGIEPVEPGYRVARIKPQLAALDEADITVPTIRGDIAAAWRRKREGVTFSVRIPANMSAEVHFPVSVDAVRESGSPVTDQAGVELPDGSSRGSVVFVGAGSYSFSWNR